MEELHDPIFDVDEEKQDESFAIKDDQMAEWAVRKIKAKEAECDRLIDLCKREIARYTAEKERLEKQKESGTSFLRATLMLYFDDVQDRHTVTKGGQHKYKLVSGTLALKPQQPEYIKDADTLLDWAKGNSAYVKTTESVDWAALKKASHVDGEELVLNDTGEVIPGVKVFPLPDKFVIEE